jgi:glycosyltransferase involved in cell wall biosynthesis
VRILHVVPSYYPALRYGGPIRSVHGLCKALAASGHEVHVFTTNVDGKQDSAVPLRQPVDRDGVKVWYFPSQWRRLYYSLSMQQALHREMSGFDVVHLHSVFLWPTWTAARIAWRQKVPYVLSPRGMLVKTLIAKKSKWIKSAWIALVERITIRNAAAIHLTSDAELKAFHEMGFNHPRVAVIPNGVDLPAGWSMDQLEEDVRQAVISPFVLYLGRINWEKGLDRLIQSWRHIPAKVRLVIAGNDEEGYLSQLQRIGEEAGVLDRVVLLPRRIEGSDKEALFASAQVYVLPSWSENFGNTVLEAMIRNCPVVVTRGVGAAGIVEESGAGIVADGEPAGLAKAIFDLLADNELRAEMAARGREAATRHYTWDKIASSMNQMYGTLPGAQQHD